MIKKIISVVMILIITININIFAAPSTNGTSELEQAQSNKKELQTKVEDLNNEIDGVLNKIDNNKTEMNNSAEDIRKTQIKLDIVEKNATDQEDLFEKRARAMYMNGVDSYIEVLLNSTSFNDVISRVDTLARIIQFDKELRAIIVKQRNSIMKNKDILTKQNDKLLALKANNEIILNKLSKNVKEYQVLFNNATIKETKLIADKKAKELAASRAISMSRHLDSTESLTPKSEAIPIDLSNSSSWSIIQSTAYSADGFTSLGSRTKRDPNGFSTIAVDPRVIPMGTKIYIEGYGYAIASDTGSAIKGNIIDLFFNTEAEALSWGRRNVKIRIIKG